MTWWRRKTAVDDLEGEFEAHLELAEHELRARGVAPDEARRLARLQFGNQRVLREDARAEAGWARLDAFALDTRHAMRRLVADPTTSVTAAALLAVAIGLGAAMFTVADALLLRPAPFRDPHTLVMVSAGATPTAVTPNLDAATYRAVLGSHGIRSLHVAEQHVAVFDDQADDDARPGARITAGLLEEFGVQPIMGRTFTSEDARDGTPVLISEAVWRDRFGAAPEILGRTLVISGRPALIIGVLPSSFRFPTSRTQVWFPFDPTSDASPRSLWIYARRTREMPLAETAAALARTLQAARSQPSASVRLRPLSQSSIDPYSAGVVRTASAGVALVFLVLCANAAAVLLTRMQRRRRMFALCAILGAPWGRLLRQALVEQAFIAGAGVLAGIGLAWYIVAAAAAWLPSSLTYTSLNLLDLDSRAVAVAACLGGLALIACGVAPAWFGRQRYAAPYGALVARGIANERTAGRVPFAGLVPQIALALLLCVAASVQWQSLANLLAVTPGIDADRLVAFELAALNDAADATPASAVLDLVRDRVKALPAVEDAAISFGTMPADGNLHFADVTSDERGAVPVDVEIASYDVEPDFFRVHGIALLQGRAVTTADAADSVVVSQSLARRLWSSGDVVGRTFRFDNGRTFTVVGVSRDVLNTLLDPRTDTPEMYERLPTAGPGTTRRHLTLRCRGVCPDVAALRLLVQQAAPGLRVSKGSRVRDRYTLGLDRPRAATLLSMTFALVGTGAAAAGLFVVLARATASRQREFGIRLALGASPRQLTWLIRMTSVRLVALALLLSACLAWPLGRLLQSVQYGSGVDQPWAWAVATLAISIAAAAATISPARQAARVDPVTLLREEG